MPLDEEVERRCLYDWQPFLWTRNLELRSPSDLLSSVLVDTCPREQAEFTRVMPWVKVPETDSDWLIRAHFFLRPAEVDGTEGRLVAPQSVVLAWASPEDRRGMASVRAAVAQEPPRSVTSTPQTFVRRCLTHRESGLRVCA